MATTYTLHRITPDGEHRTHDRLNGKRQIERAAYFCLVDNGAAGPGIAESLARHVASAPAGDRVTVAGYTFWHEPDRRHA